VVIKLRDYQSKAVEQVQTAFNHHKSVLLQMPTGTGKTIVIREVVKQYLLTHDSESSVLILTHRKILIDQIKDALSGIGNIAKVGERLSPARVHYSTMQSQIIRLDDSLERIGLVVIDEAHHSVSDSYLKILQKCTHPKRLLLGVTATPCRLDGKKLSSVFNTLITSESIQWFIENQHLCHIKHLASSIISRRDIQSLKLNKDGDYEEVAIERLLMDGKHNSNHIADVIESYQTYAAGKKCIVYAATQRHAQILCKKFLAENIEADYVIGTMSEQEIKNKIDDFKRNRFKVLINVEIFTEGFDCPDVEVVQLVRPTKSLVKYLQMAGRVTRMHKGKDHGIILDNVRLWQEHGQITLKRDWSSLWNKDAVEINDRMSHFEIEILKDSPLPNIIELTNLKMVQVSNSKKISWIPIERDFIISKRIGDIIADKSNSLRTTTDFILFFQTNLDDWNLRIGYKGKNLLSMKISYYMYQLILNYA
jgi:superfamily II DNA or RNA helicase